MQALEPFGRRAHSITHNPLQHLGIIWLSADSVSVDQGRGVPRVARVAKGIKERRPMSAVGTPIGSGGGAAGFRATFEIAAADEAGMVG